MMMYFEWELKNKGRLGISDEVKTSQDMRAFANLIEDMTKEYAAFI